MKGICWMILSAALLGPGCLHLPLHPKEEDKPVQPPPPPRPRPPAVTPDGITESNAPVKVQDLKREIDDAWSRTNEQ
jgi:hypothetical protein